MTGFAYWDENAALAQIVTEKAAALGLRACRNSSGARWGNFDGVHRYLIFDPSKLPIGIDFPTIRSEACLTYSEARYSKYFAPSEVGENSALCVLALWLEKRLHNAEVLFEVDDGYDRCGVCGVQYDPDSEDAEDWHDDKYQTARYCPQCVRESEAQNAKAE